MIGLFLRLTVALAVAGTASTQLSVSQLQTVGVMELQRQQYTSLHRVSIPGSATTTSVFRLTNNGFGWGANSTLTVAKAGGEVRVDGHFDLWTPAGTANAPAGSYRSRARAEVSFAFQATSPGPVTVEVWISERHRGTTLPSVPIGARFQGKCRVSVAGLPDASVNVDTTLSQLAYIPTRWTETTWIGTQGLPVSVLLEGDHENVAGPTNGAFRAEALLNFTVRIGQAHSLLPSRATTSIGNPQSVSLAMSGTPGRRYVVAGSLTGVAPLSVGPNLQVSLTPDAYTFLTILAPNTPPLVGGTGTFDTQGTAVATFTPPVGLPPTLVGARVYHAAVFFDQNTQFVERTSPTVVTTLVP